MEKINETIQKIINDKLGTPEEQKARKMEISNKNAKLLKDIGAVTPKLSNKTKKLLFQQLQFLSKSSYKYKDNPDKLCNLSHAMVEVVSVLHGQSQSFYGEYQPYEVQLPVKDLLDLYEHKADIIRRFS